MDTLNLRQRGTLVDALGSAVFHGGTALNDVPTLLRRVLEQEVWRDFETPLHEKVHYDRFEDFVAAPPSKGLGADIGLIRRIVANDRITMDLLDQVLQGRQGERTDLIPHLYDNVQEVAKAPTGNSSNAALRRLRAQRPDLHARVLAHELSPHAAMIMAGFRHPTFTAPSNDVPGLARALRRRFDANQLRELATHILEEHHD